MRRRLAKPWRPDSDALLLNRVQLPLILNQTVGMPDPAHGNPRHRQGKARAAQHSDSRFSTYWIGQQLGFAERRSVTVLTCGVVQPSQKDHRAGTERTARNMSFWRPQIGQIITAHGGHVIGFSGRGLLACWGFPHSGEDDAHRAVRAALRIVEVCQADLPIACALETGIAIAGGGTRSEHTIELAGSVLGTAERLHTAAGPRSVVVSDDFRPLVERFFELEPIPSTDNAAWRVLGARSAADGSAMRLPATFVGHVAERQKLDELWLRVVDGQPQCVSICGEAGIGKSRLLRYLEVKVKAAAGTWLELSCLPEARRAPLHPLRQTVGRLLKERAAGLHRYIEDLEQSDQELFQRLLESRAALSSGSAGPEKIELERIFTLILNWIAGLAANGPVVLALEDLHWADRSMLDFVAKAGERLSSLGSVCLVWTSRSAGLRKHRAAAPLQHTQITLRRLSSGEIQQLLACSPSGSVLPPEKRQRIAIRSEGIPLFATELARLCAGAQVAEHDLDLLLRPGPLNAILSARLDSLGDLKPLAQAAAVIGRQFDSGVLALVLQMQRTHLIGGLDELVALGILEQAPGSRSRNALRFTHVLLRDAAYASVLETRRHELHKRVADVLAEDVRAAEQEPEIIAGHCSAAGDAKGAFTWWYRAGLRAAELSSTRAAVHHLSQALAARRANPDAGSPPEEIEVLRLLGVQLAALKGNAAPEAVKTLERCLDLSREVLGPEGDFDTLWGLHSCYLVRGDISRALEIGDNLTASADRSGITERRLRAHRMQGLAKMLRGRLAEAFAHYRLVLELYDETRHAALRLRHASDQGALALAHLAWGEAIAGRLKSSRRHADAALALSSRLRHPHTSAHVLCVLAARAQTLGELQDASALAFAGKTLGERHEFPYWSAWAEIVLGWTHGGQNAAAGNEAGIALIEKAIRAYRRTGATQALPYALLLVAETALACNRPRRALSAAAEGWRIAQQQGLMLYGSELLRVRAVAEMKLGSGVSRIRDLIDQALGLAVSQGADTFSSRAAGFRIHPAPTCLDLVAGTPKV